MNKQNDSIETNKKEPLEMSVRWVEVSDEDAEADDLPTAKITSYGIVFKYKLQQCINGEWRNIQTVF